MRNNNPGNLRSKEGTFRHFDTMEEGEKAMDADLDYKMRKHGLNTIRGSSTVTRRRTKTTRGAYINRVSKSTGFDPDSPLVDNAETRRALVLAMEQVEQGPKGAAMVRRAIATPGAQTTNNGGATTNVTIANQTINTKATDGQAVAVDFMAETIASRRRLTAG